MKRGVRRLIVVVAAVAGALVAVAQNRKNDREISACMAAHFAHCNTLGGDEIARCYEQGRKWLVETCGYGPASGVGIPSLLGALAFVGTALGLELARALAAWVVAGFRGNER